MRVEYPADPALRPYVEGLWSVERTFAPPTDTFTLLPDRHVELVFGAGARFSIAPADPASDARGPTRAFPRAYVVGLLDGPVRLRAHGTVRAVAARCPAWSAGTLLAPLLAPPVDDDPAPLVGVRPLNAAYAPLAEAVAAALDASDVAGALGQLRAVLRTLAAAAPAVPAHVRRAAHALGDVPDSPGSRAGTDVRRAAAAAGRTPRHLERQFRALAGVTPKGYARRARFERARDRLWADPGASLSALAAECGYADQAHLTREFAAFAGAPPARWAAGLTRTRARLAGPDATAVESAAASAG